MENINWFVFMTVSWIAFLIILSLLLNRLKFLNREIEEWITVCLALKESRRDCINEIANLEKEIEILKNKQI